MQLMAVVECGGGGGRLGLYPASDPSVSISGISKDRECTISNIPIL